MIEKFPTDRPLPEQCALWMHAVIGKHFFDDANHPTAVALLRKLLRVVFPAVRERLVYFRVLFDVFCHVTFALPIHRGIR